MDKLNYIYQSKDSIKRKKDKPQTGDICITIDLHLYMHTYLNKCEISG